MSAAVLGEIRMFAGLVPPKGWALCDGSVLPIAGNEGLFGVLGAVYGGDGKTGFALPDLRGRIAVGTGQPQSGDPVAPGATGGSETVSPSPAMLPSHRHALLASSQPANTLSPANAAYATTAADVLLYPDSSKPVAADRLFNAAALAPSGGGTLPQAHDNMMPSLALHFIIATAGADPFDPDA